MSVTLLIATAREPELLALCLEGLRWCDLGGARVVVVVNNSRGDNADPRCIEVAERAGAVTHVYSGPRAPNSNGLGAALFTAAKIHEADRYVKIDADMLPLQPGWLLRLVEETEALGQELGTGLANVNGTGSKRFVEGLGGRWADFCDEPRIRYADVDVQARLWRYTLERWDATLAWSVRPPEVRTRADEYLLNANVVTWSRSWFERRSADDWLLRGEDELVVNLHHEGDQPTLAVVPSVLLLHWGYSGCKHLIDPLLPDVTARLRAHWSS